MLWLQQLHSPLLSRLDESVIIFRHNEDGVSTSLCTRIEKSAKELHNIKNGRHSLLGFIHNSRSRSDGKGASFSHTHVDFTRDRLCNLRSILSLPLSDTAHMTRPLYVCAVGKQSVMRMIYRNHRSQLWRLLLVRRLVNRYSSFYKAGVVLIFDTMIYIWMPVNCCNWLGAHKRLPCGPISAP